MGRFAWEDAGGARREGESRERFLCLPENSLNLRHAGIAKETTTG